VTTNFNDVLNLSGIDVYVEKKWVWQLATLVNGFDSGGRMFQHQPSLTSS